MLYEIGRRAWRAMPFQISRCCADHGLIGAQRACNQRRVLQFSNAHRDIEALTHEISHLVVEHQINGDIGIGATVICAGRGQRMYAKRDRRQHAQPSARLAAQFGADHLGVGDIGKNAFASRVIELSEFGKALLARRAVQHSPPKHGFERANVVPYHGSRQPELIRSRRETAALHDSYEDHHAFQPVQLRSTLW